MLSRLLVLGDDLSALRLAREFAHPDLTGERCSHYQASRFQAEQPMLFSWIDAGETLKLSKPYVLLFSGEIVRHAEPRQQGEVLSRRQVEVIAVRSIADLATFCDGQSIFVFSGHPKHNKAFTFTRARMTSVSPLPARMIVCQFMASRRLLRELLSVLYSSYFSEDRSVEVEAEVRETAVAG